MAKQIAPENVIGRDKLIHQLWKTLKKKSVVFAAERRIGKTTVLKKMAAEPLNGTIVLYTDLEKVDTPIQFVDAIINDLRDNLPKTNQVKEAIGELVRSLGGIEIAGVLKLPQILDKDWKQILHKTFETVSQKQTENRIIFLWDEVPYMLQKIHLDKQQNTSGISSALAILDSLRAIRNEHENIRMIFTGSVGIHHVLTMLRSDKFASEPLNDMTDIEVGPLTPNYAKELALNLINDENINCEKKESVVDVIVELTDSVPFYIEQVVNRLALLDKPITSEIVESQVNSLLVDPYDPWEMDHFRQRLSIYYKGDILDADNNKIPASRFAKEILGHIVMSGSPQSINDCFTALKAKMRILDRSHVIDHLKWLAQDHYLTITDEGLYQMRFSLLKRWWIKAEGLN